MFNYKKNYKIIATGKVSLRAIENVGAEKLFSKNYLLIDKIWEKKSKKKNGKLFDKNLLNFVSYNKKGRKINIIAHFFKYKNYLAQSLEKKLNLGIRLVGVSGIIILRDKKSDYVVFAQRSNNVTEYPGFIELVPSGSIDDENVDIKGGVDFKSKLLSEFTEETGLPKHYVKDITSFAFVLDTDHNVYDICCRILLKVKKDTVFKKFIKSEEYGKPIFIDVRNLNKFIEKKYVAIVPTSLAIINAYSRLKFK